MLNKVRVWALCLLFFFSACFTTTFIGPSSLRLNPFRFMMIINTLLFVINVLIKGKVIISKSLKYYFLFYNIIWIVYAIVISLFSSTDLIASIDTTIYILIGFLIYLICLNIDKSPDMIYYFLNSFLIGVLINNLISFYEIWTSNYYFTLAIDKIPTFAKYNWAVTFFANPNNMCTMLTFAVFIAYALMNHNKSKVFKIVYMFIICSSLFIMIADYSESNLVASIIGILLYIIIKLKEQKALKPIHLICFLAASIILIINIDFVLDFISKYTLGSVDQLYDDNSTLGFRLNLWKNSINNMLDYSIFGVGAGMAKYYVFRGSVNDIHSWFVQILVDYGLIFFTFYLLFYVFQIRVHRKHSKLITSNYHELSKCFFLILIMFVFFNISSSNNFTTEYIWCVWGVSYYICDLSINQEG